MVYLFVGWFRIAWSIGFFTLPPVKNSAAARNLAPRLIIFPRVIGNEGKQTLCLNNCKSWNLLK
jgi:hypothetical protein